MTEQTTSLDLEKQLRRWCSEVDSENLVKNVEIDNGYEYNSGAGNTVPIDENLLGKLRIRVARGLSDNGILYLRFRAAQLCIFRAL